MTETFWIAATVLIILALAFVLYPDFFSPYGRQETDGPEKPESVGLSLQDEGAR